MAHDYDVAVEEYDAAAEEAEDQAWKPRAIPEGARRLTKDDIAAAQDVQEIEIYIPQWPTRDGAPGTLLVRGLDRLQFHNARRRSIQKGSKGMQVDLELMERNILAEGVVDPKYSPSEIGQIMKKNMGAVQELIDAINYLSGTTKEERAKAANAFRD